ncbi:hypothetical protein DAEQUDRAFT_732163 [Daedalea quercina L-15889]|uniref:Uncharacterized protein n=1 Tax=Daedalea quercina L-15889 TaxID=1314783 RepID=A0A165LSU7_9APHY|nr:hypothetical protein DAEQUDRAFT_732163 [Daedalea quercina L-15889]
MAESLHQLDVLRSTSVQLRPSVNLSSPSPETPGSSEPPQEPEPEQNGNEISDQEWEIRTGRAIDILQQTLPDFFQTGLITALETPIIGRKHDSASNGAGGKDLHWEGRTTQPDVESIYSRYIRLSYTPPHPLPAPFPRTFTIEGSALYLASSAFVRHTLNALYTDLQVNITRARIVGGRGSGGGKSHQKQGGNAPRVQGEQHSLREKSLFISLNVSGIARVSGVHGGWDVNSTYTFSPLTGLIHLHKIDSIEPAPSQAVFDALRAALAKLGLTGGDGSQAPGAVRTQPAPVPVSAKSP